jgi:hypothetical protein
MTDVPLAAYPYLCVSAGQGIKTVNASSASYHRRLRRIKEPAEVVTQRSTRAANDARQNTLNVNA